MQNQLTEKYPKTVILEDSKLKELLANRGEIVKEVVKRSDEIQTFEEEMEQIDLKIQAIEKTVDIADLMKKEKEITKKVEACIAEMEEIKKEIYNRMKDKAPKDLYDRYDYLKKGKEKAEKDREKLALKVVKCNKKLLPYGRRVMSPYLTNKGDDFESLKLEDGEVVATVFNHFVDFEKRYDQKHNKK